MQLVIVCQGRVLIPTAAAMTTIYPRNGEKFRTSWLPNGWRFHDMTRLWVAYEILADWAERPTGVWTRRVVWVRKRDCVVKKTTLSRSLIANSYFWPNTRYQYHRFDTPSACTVVHQSPSVHVPHTWNNMWIFPTQL